MAYVDNNGVKIWYEVEGVGSPVILVHGSSMSLNSWRERGITEQLNEKHKLILMDARGHGKSDKPHDPSEYLPAPKSKDIELILDDLGIDEAHFFGYSMGGRIGLDTVAHAPQRIRSLIAGGAGPSPAALLKEQMFKKGRNIKDVLEVIESKVGRLPDKARETFLANDMDALAASQDPSILDQEELYKRSLANFAKPTLMFVGTDDPRHSDIETTVANMPNAKFISLDGLDHMGAGTKGVSSLMPQISEFLSLVDSDHN
tara:strand:- start:254 stop:1030 length:777 start_codon:yes stop_codon:yes gene_type:complete